LQKPFIIEFQKDLYNDYIRSLLVVASPCDKSLGTRIISKGFSANASKLNLYTIVINFCTVKSGFCLIVFLLLVDVVAEEVAV